MFGLMKPPVEDLAYRSAYSRCCQFQRKFYGIISVPLLSYDAVFLYLCAVDAGLVPESVIPTQKCCRLRTRPLLQNAPDADVGRFCGAISVLLADTKLQDDVRDKRSLLARFGRYVLRNPVTRAIRFVSRLDPSFQASMEEWTRAQVEIESRGSELTLTDFVQPTARGVASVARMMPGAAKLPGFQDFLWRLGQHLGVAFVAADCALDWRDDLKSGECNPVKNVTDAVESARLALSHLYQAQEASEQYLGPTSRTAQVGRLVCAGVGQKLKEKCHLDEADVRHFHVGSPEPKIQKQEGPLNSCVGIAKRVGATVGRQRSLPTFDKKKQVECPQSCQCSCQLLGGLLLLLGCAESH